MYNILIVDDEKKEREGIALLLKRFGFPLRTAFAQNGEDALKIMEKNHFDILLTDIKMPYMDGIQLIRETQKRGLNPICIIYSAYGEFEYAQNAISLGVQEYLLKPVKLDAFKALFEKIIEICQEKEIEKKNRNDIIQAKEEAAQQKLSWNLLNYLESEELEEGTLNHWETLKNEFTSVVQKKICIPVIISCYSNLFSIEWEEYLKDIREYFGKETVIITNTDNQIIVLLIRERDFYRTAETKKECEILIEKSQKKYQVNIFVVLGKKTESLTELKKEYTELKDQLDYQFFVSKSMVLVHDEDYFLKKENDMLSLYFERIFNCARMQDYSGIKKEFVKVFAYIMKQTGFSSIYVKYTFTDA
ncbi:MAG: response regulator, partial [Blautia faecis]